MYCYDIVIPRWFCACYIHWDKGVHSLFTLSDISCGLAGSSLSTQSHLSSCASRFDIVLMKEGRMKGQAFVGLPNERCAEKALRDTNGYVLYDKPLVVQFARSAKPKADVPDPKKGSRPR